MVDLKKQPFYLSTEQVKWVEDTMEMLSTEQKAGQLFCVMGGDYPPQQLKEMVRESRVGGILYRPAPAEEIRAKYAQLDAVASVPLLKAANLEEGGAGAISDGTLFGWPMLAAAADDPEQTEHFARSTASEGKEVGINWTFSPVCDLDMNFQNPITNVRTCGSDLDKVLRGTEIFAEVMQRNGIAACAKHFPGDGVDYRDQHLHPSYNSLTAEEWYASYGRIYQNLISKDLMSVMVGHIVQPNVEMDINPELKFEDCMPGSLSKELLTGVLREKFGFNGVITTDATIMGGFCMAMERRLAIPAAIMAGNDMLVFNTNFEEDYAYILEALNDGRLTMERLDEAVTRILALKAKVCREHPYTEITRETSQKWHRECAKKAVTLVKNLQPEVWPVTRGKYDSIRLIILGNDTIPEGTMSAAAKSFLEQRGFTVDIYQPLEDELHGTKELPDRRLTLYLANYEHASNQTAVRINWCQKHALDSPRFLNEEPCIFVSMANPYLLQDVPRVKTYINAYTATAASVEVVLEKLLGEGEFTGVSPVDAFCGLPDTRI
ncbi:MAG: glycosyl hydrolase family 3 [Lachnospiraceae bacterium]|nr:glycosyl hydrolase family 3 [Lachnospiraceae bacterium]